MRHVGMAGIIVIGAAAVLAGCTRGSNGVVDEGGEDVEVGEVVAGLARADDCGDLLSRIQADALVKLDEAAATLKTQTVKAREGGFNGGWGGGLVSGPPTAEDGDSASGSGGTTGAPVDGEAPSSPEPSGHSDTNTQVAGVDEADIVKTDGTRTYLLHGDELFVLGTWPAESTSVAGHAKIEGTPVEMFVADGRAVVFSHVYDVAGQGGGAEPGIAADCYDCYYGAAFTKISVLDVTGSTPTLSRELYFEGNYVSSRRHDAIVRGVIRGGFAAPNLYAPSIAYYDAWGDPYDQAIIDAQIDQWRARAADDIRKTELSDWLPSRYEKRDGELVALEPACGDTYVPTPGLATYGQTNVVTLDMTDPASLAQTVVLGGADQVYANADVLLLAQHDYRWDMNGITEQQTALHSFSLGDASTTYVGSGFVPGYIHNQFSLDERDGVFRLSTTQQRRTNAENPWETTSVNRVVTVHAVGDALQVLGQTPELAPGETIFSTRFIGDRAYVVTFRQTDPLFAIDLSDPAEPKVLGELHIPGFSDYMHPLDDTHLLTIGRDATDQGVVQGLMLQIFDVSDPTNLRLTHRHVYEREGYSQANHDHKAFTYYADKQLLAFPFVGYSPEFTSSLELFRVSVETGFDPLGSVDHGALMGSACEANEWEYYCPYPVEMRRGLFIDDYVYSISYAGVLVHGMGDLTTPVATVPLPAPTMSYGYYPVPVDGGAATPSSGGAAGAGPIPDEPDAPGSGGAGGAAPDPDSDSADAG